jgi:hypothetical protein
LESPQPPLNARLEVISKPAPSPVCRVCPWPIEPQRLAVAAICYLQSPPPASPESATMMRRGEHKKQAPAPKFWFGQAPREQGDAL